MANFGILFALNCSNRTKYVGSSRFKINHLQKELKTEIFRCTCLKCCFWSQSQPTLVCDGFLVIL